MHCAVQGEAATPPTTPIDGQCWLVGTNPSGAWAGQSGKIACRQSGQWLFITPRDGMRITSMANGQEMRYFNNSWIAPIFPVEPFGGSVVDTEARATIVNLLQKLRDVGIFSGD